MKFIDRNSVPTPDSLDLNNVNSNASKELVAVRSHMRSTPYATFNFKAYKKGDDVKEALGLLFKGICAYCESKIDATSPGDVEHYRPKSEVKEYKGHPGYWWIAADWNNLLMSCTDCNRGRYHHYYDVQQAKCSLSETKEKLGKDSSFPILGPNYATLEGQDLSNEDAALIDPTKNDPAKHLIWKIHDDLPLLAPIQRDSKLDPYGEATIQVLGLNRLGLVEMRALILQLAQYSVSLIRDDLAEIIESSDEQKLQEDLNKAISRFDKLYRFSEDDKPYSSMLRNFLDMEKQELIKKYSIILSELQKGDARH